MNLAERRGCQRRRVEMAKQLGYLRTKFVFDDEFDILVAERFDLVLQSGKRLEKLFRNQIGAAGKKLAQFHKGRAKTFKVVRQLAGQGVPISGWGRGLFEAKALP